jgi:hypothetical protein
MQGAMNVEGPLGILIVHMLVNNRFKEGEGHFIDLVTIIDDNI